MTILQGGRVGIQSKGAKGLPSALPQCELSIFVSVVPRWFWIDLNRSVHAADVIHTVFTAAPAPIPCRGSVPAAFLSVPFEAQLFELFLMRFGVTADPYKATDDLYGDVVQLDQLIDQPLEFLRRLFGVAFVSFAVLVDVDPFHALEHDLIFGV